MYHFKLKIHGFLVNLLGWIFFPYNNYRFYFSKNRVPSKKIRQEWKTLKDKFINNNYSEQDLSQLRTLLSIKMKYHWKSDLYAEIDRVVKNLDQQYLQKIKQSIRDKTERESLY